jgi:hypothetical protein
MWGIYKELFWSGLRCQGMHIKFMKIALGIHFFRDSMAIP